MIGTYCKVDEVDSYLVHANNETGEVTAVHVSNRCSIKLADSIEELLMTMKGIW
ncbi:MAG: SecY-interacting protein Syd [Oscillospiraceae bacterium]|nr:SecY-interacting protein Syd [Oscillospiraceae bacterium]